MSLVSRRCAASHNAVRRKPRSHFHGGVAQLNTGPWYVVPTAGPLAPGHSPGHSSSHETITVLPIAPPCSSLAASRKVYRPCHTVCHACVASKSAVALVARIAGCPWIGDLAGFDAMRDQCEAHRTDSVQLQVRLFAQETGVSLCSRSGCRGVPSTQPCTRCWYLCRNRTAARRWSSTAAPTRTRCRRKTARRG